MMKNKEQLKIILEEAFDQYYNLGFIDEDPIQIPHKFTLKQDIEIIGLWTAVLSFGRRNMIIKKSTHLIELLEHAPYDFIINHSEKEKERFQKYVHRTFQPTDALYFLDFLKNYYKENDSLETAFSNYIDPQDINVRNGLIGFHNLFFLPEFAPKRTKKHIPTPERNSACKRLNMFLRWMVRPDDAGIDFGIWKNIKTSQLIIPLDTHVHQVATKLGILKRKQSNWKAAVEITENLKELDPIDPVRFDYALFKLGIDKIKF